MTALAQSRRLREERWTYKKFPLAAVAAYYAGAAVFDTSTGYVTKASASTTLKAIGTFAEDVDNSGGAAGDLSVNVKLAGEVITYRFANGTGGDEIVTADVGKPCYFLDDQTVTIVPTGHSVAGIVWDVDATKGVAVQMLVPFPVSLAAAPTISDFTSATHDHTDAASGGVLRLASANAISFTAGDCAIATPGNRKHYKVPTTATNSTVSLGTTGAVRGDQIVFTADGSANGHTVTYRDGSTAISAAATASKRHTAICTYDGSVWTCALSVGP